MNPASVQPQRSRISADGMPQTFNMLTEEYFDNVYFPFSPTLGTSIGFHQYDTQLEDYSAAGVQREIAANNEYLKKFEEIDPTALDRTAAGDLAMVIGNIRSTLLSLETIRMWEKDPDSYSSGITNSVYVLMERHFAPPDTRLRAVVERERKMPQVLQDARINLKNPPRVYTEIAIEQLPGIISFFQTDLPSAFTDAKDPQVRADFTQTNATVITALQSYLQWLQTDLLPRSNGDFRIGADAFRRKLSYDEMVDIPLDRLLQIGYDDLHKNQAEFALVAHQLDPNKTPRQVLAELAADYPPPDQLLNAFQNTFSELTSFIQSHHIIDIPSEVQPTLEETPPFMRATTIASMDPPGPYETNSTQAFFNVTLPGKNWAPQQIAEHMAMFNVGTIISISVHEAWPGHYVQFLWTPEFPSKVRKILGANTNIEGWAHYCEQMMLDQGFAHPGDGAKDLRESELIRLGQLQDALQRDARFIVSIRMHTGVGGAMSFDDAVNFFVTQGYQSHAVGEIEAKRGTSDATYLYYTLGKLEIMKLRADVMKKEGAAFSLEKFHDNFMRQGFAPIKIIRQAMLGDNSPVL